MITYDEMVSFVNDFELINNRVAIINQILGGSFQHPFALTYHKGQYTCRFYDADVCSFGVYDSSALHHALQVLNSWESKVWLLSRNGFITQPL